MSLPQFVSSNDICDALKFSKRTLQRRFHCPTNPLPQPCIKRVGGLSMWEFSIARAWIEREKGRSKNEQLDLDFGGEL